MSAWGWAGATELRGPGFQNQHSCISSSLVTACQCEAVATEWVVGEMCMWTSRVLSPSCFLCPQSPVLECSISWGVSGLLLAPLGPLHLADELACLS